ncbi:HEAT repeat domain-containing protein [Ruegeria sp. 2205SS24-7]|uniref:HEAT repeat domain-containing protein n=1 Tax=Ruegeria discodermiae TaxID=3064389 RepID=UPI0027429077|nr:HEAT repeat domain-containing protein [Ruegeria sp. 2205SS24-7]MDP5218553.1 HEAT repeat domain-containing protein [Ruegeria sp. 2205SS24-7]
MRAILEGRSDRLAVGTALALLAGQRHADVAYDLADVFQDQTRNASLRAQAVRLFSGTRPSNLTEILVRTLADPETAVLRETLRALGRLGDISARDAIKRAERCSNGRVERDAKFAVLLLSARHHLKGAGFAGWPCEEPVKIDDDCGELAIIRSARKVDVRAALSAFEDDPMDVSFVPGDAQIIEGLGLDWQFLPVRGIAEQLSTAPEAPVLMGVLAEWDPSDDKWFEGYLLFADPAEDKGTWRHMALIDTASEIVMRGRLQQRSGSWYFEFDTTSPTMLQANMSGEICDGRLQLVKMLYRSTLKGRRRADLI